MQFSPCKLNILLDGLEKSLLSLDLLDEMLCFEEGFMWYSSLSNINGC